MKKIIIFLLCTGLFGFSDDKQNQFKPVKLRTEGLIEPECIDVPNPRFSWQIESVSKGQMQTAFRLIVASSNENIHNNNGDMYDSRKVKSSENTFVLYKGKGLESAKTYYWKVKTWDKNNNAGEWSNAGQWTTGLINSKDKKAKWIANKKKDIRAPLFRKEFKITKPVKSASAYVTGIGIYYLFVNGNKLGDAFIDPGMTNYKSRVLYGYFDLKPSLKAGQNAIGLLLGEGMGAFSYSRKDRYNNKNNTESPYDKPMGWFQLEIEYEDGSKETIISNHSWKTHFSHISYNNFYGGEDYNAKLENKSWSDINFNDEDWENAEELRVQTNLQARMHPPIRIKETFSPVVTTNPEPGIFCYDFGQNIGGIWRIKVKGDAGTRIKIRGSEKLEGSPYARKLTADARPDFSLEHHRKYFYHRDCYSNYILSGESEEVYQPLFFYNGFRYLQIEVDKPGAIELLESTGSFVYSDLHRSGDFKCSDTLLTQLHKMTDLTVKGILQSVPTSNPHSEKYGWTGDVHLFSEAANFNLYMYPLWKNWLADIDATQKDMGKWRINEVVPPYRKKDHLPVASATWGAVLPILVINTYRYYGDLQIVERYYENVKGWCDYLSFISNDFIVRGKYGDHESPGVDSNGEYISRGSTSEIASLIATAYYYRTSQIVAELSEILDKQHEKNQYETLAKNIKNAFNNAFFNRDKGIYENLPSPEGFSGLQTANLLPLEFDMVPKTYIETVLQNVIKDIKLQHNGHLATGIIGTKSIMEVFPKYGYQQLLFDIIHQEDFPGYGHWVKNGATTIWQKWNGAGDHMHAMYGSVEQFNYNHVLGIHSPNNGKTSSKFKHIHIEPWFDGEISWAEGFLETPLGKISVNWKKNDEDLKIEVSIPVNSTATLALPAKYHAVYESNRLLGHKKINLNNNSQKLMMRIGSGKYSFRFSKSK